jgi:membrane fusion protein (multidrug efflux system)
MKIRNLILIVLILGAAVAAKLIFFPANKGEGGQIQKTGPAATMVKGYIVKPEKLDNSIYASATLLANEEANLQPELSGKVMHIYFTEGSTVTRSQLLVKINDEELQAEYQKLKTQLALAETRLNRSRQLLAVNGISKEEFDITENQYLTLKADIEYNRAQIAKTEIHAPFNGIVGLRNISEGSFITPQTIIASVQQVNPVKVDFTVSERYAGMLKKGDRVIFTIEGRKEEFTGEVFAIDPKIDIATRSLRVRALCPNPKNILYPGSFAHVRIELETIDNALMVPTESVVPEMKGKKIYRVKNGTADFISIETGIRTEEKIQVLSGLNAGDTVIVSGIMQLKPGSTVKVKEVY